MPLIRGKLDNKRAIVDVGLQPSTAVVEGVAPVAAPPIINISPFRGLLDTGAQVTCVTRSTARLVGLVPRGRRRLGNVSNIEMHTSFSFVLGVWYSVDGGEMLNETRGYYAFDPIFGCDFKDNEDFHVLIGMDVITQGDFRVTRDGRFQWDLP